MVSKAVVLFSFSSDASVEILCKDESVLGELNAALRDIEGQCRTTVRVSVANQSVAAAGPVLTHSVSESCRGLWNDPCVPCRDIGLLPSRPNCEHRAMCVILVVMQVPEDTETSQRVQSEISRLEKRVAKSRKALDGLVNRRSDPQYATKVPEAVQAQDEQRLMQTETDLHATEKSLAALRELQYHY